MRGRYTIPGYFENCTIKNNEVRQGGSFGKTLFYYKNKELKSSGFLSKTILIFKNGGIYQPGILGKKIFNVTHHGEVKKIGLLGKTVGAIPAEWVYSKDEIDKKINPAPATTQAQKMPKEIKGKIKIDDKTTKHVFVKGDKAIVVDVTIEDDITADGVFRGDYNELLAFYTFLLKYPVIKTSALMKESDYSQWEFMRYGVKNVKNLHKELEEKNFYKQADVKESLSVYKNVELKKIADDLGVNVKGKKEAIIEQLSTEITITSLIEITGDKILSISNTAEAFLKKHELEYDYYNSSFYPDISIKDYIEIRKIKSLEDLEIEEINKEIRKDKKEWGRNDYYARSRVYLRIEEPKNALRDLLIVLRNDLSGVTKHHMIKSHPDVLEFRNPPSSILFAPGLLRDIIKLKEHYNETILNEVYKIKLPIDATSKEMFSEIVTEIFDGTLNESKYIELLKDSFIEKVSIIPFKWHIKRIILFVIKQRR